MRLVLVSALILTLTACIQKEPGSTTQGALGTAIPVAPGGYINAQPRAIAAMDDRGTLNAFAMTTPVRQEGGISYHPVKLSESHALAASAQGRSLRFTQPDGSLLEIPFERIEEGRDGNWTWIGRTADGLDAGITFGEQAVFGSVARADGPAMRIVTEAGRTWLAVAGIGGVLDGDLIRDAGDPDFLIPDRLIKNAMQRKQASAAEGAIPTKNAANTVDVVLGFTTGMVTKLGSTSAVNTRLTNLIALTNQAYTQSQVTPRVRLVHTLQVNYTDSNDNETALEALSGFACNPSCVSQTVPAELVPLRNARETYGADLVSLVRPFQTPQHDGCGIAWLLGGGGFPIDNTDAPFGYSVVSDGTDVNETDGKNYVCRDATLAHELGHNMGQTHNPEDAGSSGGTHSYSYGYREASSTGFYTIMAYRLANSSQFTINYFGNPNVNDAGTGRPTGSATADNARSLNISMPLVAQFRNTVVPFAGKVRNDINGDGRSDIIWRNQSLELMDHWTMNGPVFTGGGAKSVSGIYRIVATGDFDGDGRGDLLWTNNSNDLLWIWRSRGDGQYDVQFVSGYPPSWSVAGTADVNGDGKSDIIWRNQSLELMDHWLMNGPSFTIGGAKSVSGIYRIVATGDFDGDGRSDLLWTNDANDLLWIWRSRGDGQYDVQFVSGYPPSWAVAGTADVNGDGRSDIIWRNQSLELMDHWLMNGPAFTGGGAKSVSGIYRIVGTGDFDGDGRGDLLWTNNTNDLLWIWRSRGDGQYDVQFVSGYPPSWAVAGGTY